MNKRTKPAGFFAKMTGPLTWAERVAKLKGAKKKPAVTAKLEIDDANGEKLTFPDIGAVSEIDEDVAVTATDGDHVFTADGSTYTISVLAGKVTKVIEDTTEEVEEVIEAEALNEETEEFITAVATELATNEEFRATTSATIESLTGQLATALGEIKKLKGLMKHGGDGTRTDDVEDDDKPLVIGGKKIDIKKINFKKT